MGELRQQATFHHEQLQAALAGDRDFVQEVVRLAGVTDEGVRKAATGNWAVSPSVG